MTVARVFRSLLFLPLYLAAASVSAQSGGFLQAAAPVSAQGGWQLSWPSIGSNMVYTIQFQETLQDVIWRNSESPVPFPVSSNSWTSPASSNATRFFRIIAVPAAERGRLVSASLSNTVTAASLTLLFNLAGIPITPQYNVRLYKLVYETIDPLGARTQASGALIVPENATGSLPLVSYQHDTLLLTNSVPSSMDLLGEVTIGIAFATTGYAAVVPDYLGLGDSPGLHPYHHARSEATACVDMLRAAKSFCASNSVELNRELFLCGFSEGGHATLALLREIEAYHTNEFSVTACASLAGAYDLSGVTTSNFLSGALSPNPYYFLYLLAAYQSVYHFAGKLSDVLAAPYDSTLPPLMDGNHDGTQLNNVLPSDPTRILKPEYLAALRTDPRHPLRLALADNDVYQWRPLAPLRLYHCAADQDVIIANSQVAFAAFQALGATQVQLIDPAPSADHGGCSLPSLALAKAWFDSLR